MVSSTPSVSSAPSYLAEPGLLLVRWQAESSPLVLCAEYDTALALAAAYATPRLLLDVRRRTQPPVEAVNWIMLNWLPRTAARFAPRPLYVAYLLSPERATELAADPFLLSLVHDALAPNCSYQLAVFTDEAAARQWLAG